MRNLAKSRFAPLQKNSRPFRQFSYLYCFFAILVVTGIANAQSSGWLNLSRENDHLGSSLVRWKKYLGGDAKDSPVSSTAAPVTRLSMQGEPGDYIGGTTQHLYTPDHGTFGATAQDRSGDGIPDYVQVSFSGPNHWWYTEFHTYRVPNQNLVVGYYENAQRAPFADANHPGLNISGDGRGCNTLTGNFTVHDVAIDSSGSSHTVRRFTASFEQHCEGGGPALLGTVYYNYEGASPVHVISGRVVTPGGAGVGGVTVTLGGSDAGTAITDGAGNYSFPGLIEGGNFRLTSGGNNFIFDPQAYTFKRLRSDPSAPFTAIPKYRLSGRITDASGNPISGVSVSLTGTQTGNAFTDNSGNYAFDGLRSDGNYTVTPSRTNLGFTPPSRTYNTLTGDTTANFTGELRKYTLSGRVIDVNGVGVGGVTLQLTGAHSRTTQTDSTGNYSLVDVPATGSYTLTPSKTFYTFNPPSFNFFNLSNDFPNINFTARVQTHTISGLVLDSGGNGIGGVTVSLGGAHTASAITNGTGSYAFTNLPAGSDYTVSVSHTGYSFVPTSRAFTALGFNQTGNFVGTLKGFQFEQLSYTAGEGSKSASVTVTRTGDLASAASVDVSTIDDPAEVPCDPTSKKSDGTSYPQGNAYARCDYATTVLTLNFAAGVAQQTVQIPLVDDGHVEGNESLQLKLASPINGSLGVQINTSLTIIDNDVAGQPNPISATPFFVRMHYLDFLNREPEEGEPWSGVLNSCSDVNNNPLCDRVLVSQSFFGSPEFRLKGFFVYNFYSVALNRRPTYEEIIPDMRRVTGTTEQEVYQKRAAFPVGFTERAEFKRLYDAMSNTDFVNTLLGRYGLQQITAPDPANPESSTRLTLTREDLISGLGAQSLTRAQVLRAVVESNEVGAAEYNKAFVAMQYYGYLRRAPEEDGYQAWLRVINQDPNNIRIMVNGFMNSPEYKLRFGNPNQ
ncbi:MAG TPA: carboxypeptidase regulatory-like domain-containing protein [Pyrinomonadaceae bacterium]